MKFSGYEWNVRPSGTGGPGPNEWAPANVWLDSRGFLHLRIAKHGDKWRCSEVSTVEKFGFGTYEFEIEGPIDRLDPNIVLGLFTYPTADIGKDGTHEIDIEFSRWGIPTAKIGNYGVWPVDSSLKFTGEQFEFTLPNKISIQRFTRSDREIAFHTLDGTGKEIKSWRFKPEDASARVSAKAMRVHMNLWLFEGRPPVDEKEVEIVVRKFSFRKS